MAYAFLCFPPSSIARIQYLFDAFLHCSRSATQTWLAQQPLLRFAIIRVGPSPLTGGSSRRTALIECLPHNKGLRPLPSHMLQWVQATTNFYNVRRLLRFLKLKFCFGNRHKMCLAEKKGFENGFVDFSLPNTNLLLVNLSIYRMSTYRIISDWVPFILQLAQQKWIAFISPSTTTVLIEVSFSSLFTDYNPFSTAAVAPGPQ